MDETTPPSASDRRDDVNLDLRREAVFAPATFDERARTVELVWSTGAQVQRTDWWTGETFIEELSLDRGAVDLTRLNNGAPILDTHGTWSIADQIGVVERAWIDAGEGRALVRFSSREEIAGLVADIRDGIVRNVSVGYRVQKWSVTEATAALPKIKRAEAWTPYEISFVPIPADAGAQTRGAAAGHRSTQEVRIMDENDTAAGNPPPANPAPANLAAANPAAAEGARAEPAATLAQLEALRTRTGLPAEWTITQMSRNATLDQARDAAIDAMAASRAQTPAGRHASHITLVSDERDTKIRLMSNALEHRAMPRTVKLEDGARQFRGMRLSQIAAECLADIGIKTRGMTPMEIAELALGGPHRLAQRTGAFSTSDFPNLLANTASKSLRAAYTEAPRTFTRWCSQHNLPDFKSFREVALGAVSNLDAIQEQGEITYGTLGEGAETWNLVRYGKAIAFTYVAMVNDDMSGFTRIPALFASAAARLESDMVYYQLLANANLADGIALFHGNHGNLISGATSALTADGTGIAAVGQLATRLAKQTAPGTASPLNLAGDVILVPPSVRPAALSLWARNQMPAQPSSVNPYAGDYEVVSEARLELGANGAAGSATAWYLIASPNAIDTIHYGYLEGEDGPRITQDMEFDTDGLSIKVTHNFGAKAIDFRGMAKSAGA